MSMLGKHGLFFFLMLGVVSAQLQEPRFTAESNVVLVPTLVRDQQGDPVYGLSSDDFIVEDDGALQSARLDEQAETEPISMMIAIQRGRRAKHEFSRIRALGSMLDPIVGDPQTETAVLVFDSGLDLIQDFTEDPRAVEASLKKLQPGDKRAAILDAVQYSVKLLNKRSRGRRHVLLLISETRDHGSRFARVEE